MNIFVYFILGVYKDGKIGIYCVTKNWRSSLCDCARNLSIEHEGSRYMLVQLFLSNPTSHKVLYIFQNGHLLDYHEQ